MILAVAVFCTGLFEGFANLYSRSVVGNVSLAAVFSALAATPSLIPLYLYNLYTYTRMLDTLSDDCTRVS